MRAITVIPAKMPSPMGSTDMLCPGIANACTGDGEASEAACEPSGEPDVADEVADMDPVGEVVREASVEVADAPDELD